MLISDAKIYLIDSHLILVIGNSLSNPVDNCYLISIPAACNND